MKPTPIIAASVCLRNVKSMGSIEATGFINSNKTVEETSNEDCIFALDWGIVHKIMKDQALVKIKKKFQLQS